LTLNPAQASATCVLTATIKSGDYPTVTYSQDITAIIEQPKPLSIATMTLNATINQEASLDLPQLDASYSYLVTSKPTF
jgi:hypothetical protein